jgi:hypothetical protein
MASEPWSLCNGFCYILGVTKENFLSLLQNYYYIIYSKESNTASKPWSKMMQHILPLAVVTDENLLLHHILFKRIKNGFLGKSSNCGPCATDVLLPYWGLVTEEKLFGVGA